MSAKASDHDLSVRFFTPTTEISMCGHNTIALHYVRAIEGLVKPGRSVQKTKAGLIPVEISKDANGKIMVTMTQSNPTFENLPNTFDRGRLAAALGISVDDLDTTPIQIASTGNRKLIIGVRSREILNNLKPNQGELLKIGTEFNILGFYTFKLSADDKEALTHGRMFAPNLGIPEDPVTGMSIGPLGAYLVQNRLVNFESSTFSFRAKQGEGMNRPGFADVRVHISDSRPTQVDVSGTATIVFKTEIEI